MEESTEWWTTKQGGGEESVKQGGKELKKNKVFSLLYWMIFHLGRKLVSYQQLLYYLQS